MKITQTEKISFISSGILWLVIFAGLLYIPVKNTQKPVYKTVRIQLEQMMSAPDVRSESARAEPAAAADSPDSAQPAADVRPELVKAAPAKPAAHSTSPAPVPVQQTLVPSIDDLIASSRAPKKSAAVWDDSAFENAQTVTSSSSSSLSSVYVQNASAPALSGTAASAASAQPQPETRSSSATLRTAAQPSAPSSADSYLEAIAGAPSSSKSSSDVAGQKSAGAASPDTSNNTGSPAGRNPAGRGAADSDAAGSESAGSESAGSESATSLQLNDGSYRRILSPAKPEITLSPSARRLIDGPRTVTVTFKILSGGSVPLVNIEILPAGLLPLEVQSEIKQQIITWIFETAAYDGQARFIYSINKG